jgi:hypothetical protein
MSKSEENRYPNSAELFKFCKEALSFKHHNEVKVIDQHVGAILGYDPADCSHWKKGKKNIKSIQTVNTIAQHLDLDARLVTDLVSGRMELVECLQEYKGYGASVVSLKHQEEMKREFFKTHSNRDTEHSGHSFEAFTDLKRALSLKLSQDILAHSQVKSCPVMLPELSFPQSLKLTVSFLTDSHGPKTSGSFFESTSIEHATHVTVSSNRTLPHTRFLLARELGRILLEIPESVADTDELNCARINLFAGLLLIPGHLLQKVCRQLPASCDLVAEMASIFWVGRSVMTARLKDFMQNGN